MTGPARIIDLMQAPDSWIESVTTAQNSSGQESRRKRRQKTRRSTVDSSPAPIDLSRCNSLERRAESTKRKRKDPLEEHITNQDLNRGTQEVGNTEGSDQQDAFFIDLTPASIPPISQCTPQISDKSNDCQNKLLVPSHVIVLGNTPSEVISTPLSDSDDEDFIKYLDYEDTKVRANYPS